ncbi:MAG TPA: helix-turn-helix domain-containing protein [Phycisphaerae bacterium]|nr:helix-turn-helix domain-containing protein [Phycisphaerae bacterium]
MPSYLTIEEVAERLGVDYKTVYRLIRSGEIAAGKIGRVYRILDTDLDAYFARQKQLMARQTRGLKPLEGTRCAACAELIVSELSVGGHCAHCGHEICLACWSIRKVRACPTHEPFIPKNLPSVAASTPVPAHDAVQPVAEAVDPAQAAARLQAEGKPAITAADAVAAEEAFIRAFARRLELIDDLPDPISGTAVRLRAARVKHELESAAPAPRPGLPANRISRFTLRFGGWGRPKACLTLEARFICRPDVLAAQGYDAEPVSDAELAAALNAISDQAAKAGCFHAVIIGSPTGFSESARAIIVDPARSAFFRDRLAAVALLDLHADVVTLDETDERFLPFWPLVAPARFRAALDQCQQTIRQVLAPGGTMTLAEAALACRVNQNWMRTAATELARDGEFAMERRDDNTLVIIRKG